jgi:hypothetical protein
MDASFSVGCTLFAHRFLWYTIVLVFASLPFPFPSCQDKVPLFGPLLDGAIVPAALLPQLVRQTALNANRAVRYNQAGFNRPFPTRKKYIDEIITRHAQQMSTDQFMANFF